MKSAFQNQVFRITLIVIICLLPFRIKAVNAEQKSPINSDILLNVLISEEQSKPAQALMDAMAKYWKCCKYEFIDMKEMKTRCSTHKYFLIFGGVSGDESSPAIGWLAILDKGALATVGSTDFRGPLYVAKDKKTGKEYLSYESSLVIFGVNTYIQTTKPDFYIAMMNLMFNRKIVEGVKKRCFDGKNETPEGMFLFDHYTTDYFKGKTLLIDEKTQFRMIKVFKDEAVLKTVISKTTTVPEEKIIILNSDEFCKTFLSEKEDVLYMYTYYSYMETNSENKTGLLWMAPNILNYKGEFVASLDNYKELKKKHLE